MLLKSHLMLHQQVRLEKATVVQHVQEEDREFLYEMLKDMKIKQNQLPLC